MKAAVLATLLLALPLSAEIAVQRVVDDAGVVDRVVEVSRRGYPQEPLRRIVREDIDILRGRRADGTFEFAYYDRFEAGRHTESDSVGPKGDELTAVKIEGSFVYRLLIEVPTRRLLVARNRKLWVQRVEVEYIPEGTSAPKSFTTKIEAWLEPGTTKALDLPEIPRQATARVYVKADEQAGTGNIELHFLEARIVDDVKSPFATAVTAAKTLLRSIDGGDADTVRSDAGRLKGALVSPSAIATVSAPRETPASGTASVENPDLYRDLQAIEDLLTGTDAERREGLDRLHQLVRRFRP